METTNTEVKKRGRPSKKGFIDPVVQTSDPHSNSCSQNSPVMLPPPLIVQTFDVETINGVDYIIHLNGQLSKCPIKVDHEQELQLDVSQLPIVGRKISNTCIEWTLPE